MESSLISGDMIAKIAIASSTTNLIDSTMDKRVNKLIKSAL